MANQCVKREVNALIEGLSVGQTFTIPEIYDKCSSAYVTLGQVSSLVRISPMVELLTPLKHNEPKLWRRV